jgi:hypothetical protein
MRLFRTAAVTLVMGVATSACGYLADDAGERVEPDGYEAWVDGQGLTKTVGPSADAFVRGGASASTNYGSRANLKADLDDAGVQVHSYLKFAVPSFATVTSAKVRLYVSNGSTRGPNVVSVSSSAWSEASIIWNNRPATGATLTSIDNVAANTWIEIDVTSLVRSGQTLSLALVPRSTDGFIANAKEAKTDRPQLVLVLPSCGDGTCASDESCTSCQIDCGVCTAPSLASSSTFQDLPFGAQTGSFEVQFDAKPSQSPMNGVTGLAGGTVDAFTDLAVSVRFNDAGLIDARHGGTYVAQNAVPYAGGGWYHFKLAIDLVAHRYSVSVTPPSGPETVVGRDLSFRTEQSSAALLDHLAIWADVGTHLVTNVQVTTSAPPPSNGAKLIFATGFEGITVGAPKDCWGGSPGGCWQDLVGTDSSTGFTFPIKLWGGTSSRFQLLYGSSNLTPTSILNYMKNEIQLVTGPHGTPTHALYEEVKQRASDYCCTQNNYQIFPAQELGDLYMSEYIKLQPDFERELNGEWRVITEWKTAGDYRISLCVTAYSGYPVFRVMGDNYANGGLPPTVYWQYFSPAGMVPGGEWFRVEVFFHRSSGSDGRYWVAINNKTLYDKRGPNIGVNNKPIDRIFPFKAYTGGLPPTYQWVDDLELWDSFPATASPH